MFPYTYRSIPTYEYWGIPHPSPFPLPPSAFILCFPFSSQDDLPTAQAGVGGVAFGHDTVFGEGQGQRCGEPYRVMVTFVNPEIDKATEPDHDRF
ncbi:MAG: hypothetical protein KJ638_08820 [Chloroflexi bacterium]|nr:hypothetical protein [Chloroflexota bacterium]